GANIVAAGRKPNGEVAGEIRSKGARTLEATCDVGDRASLEALREAVLREFAGVDILVNCAGRTFRKPTKDVGDEEWTGLLDTNLTGTLRACQAFYEPLKASGRGRIVNVASLASFIAFHEVAAY